MYSYPFLPDKHLWTLTDSPESTVKTMTISDDSHMYYLVAMLYPENVYNSIIEQSHSYKIITKSVIERYDGTETSINNEHIHTDKIVVKDNSFAGIFTLCTYRGETRQQTVRYKEYKGILFADGTAVCVNYDMFEADPGAFRTKNYYSLEKYWYFIDIIMFEFNRLVVNPDTNSEEKRWTLSA